MQEQFAVNSFRRDLARSVSSNFVWPWLLLVSGCLFFGDVFVRRVAVDFQWVGPTVARLKQRLTGRHDETGPVEELARLRNRKAEVASQIEDRRAAARFEVDPDADVDTSVLETPTGEPAAAAKPKRDQEELATEEDESFTSRLMKAKRDARRERDKDQ